MELNQKPNPKLKPSDGTDFVCEKCGSLFFHEAYRFKKYSKFLTGLEDDKLVPWPILRCDDCGWVNSEFQIDFDKL